MKRRLALITFSMFVLLSCNKSKENISNEDLNLLLSNSLSKYYRTNNRQHLVIAYSTLRSNKDFVTHGLSGKNSLPIISLLMSMKKYDELKRLLLENKTINKYNKINALNTVRFLKLKDKDKSKADLHIMESLKLIKDTIKKVPQDSLLYLDYFAMRMFVVGKEQTIKEIDSMKLINKKYSLLFYDDILKESIESYPLK